MFSLDNGAGIWGAGIWLMVFFGVGACNDAVSYRTSVEVSQHDTGIERAALDGAVRDFFGDRLPDDDDDGLLNGDGAFSTSSFERRRSAALSLRGQGRIPLNGRWSVIGDAALSKGSGAYALPEGTTVLTDAATVAFSSVALSNSVGLAYSTRHASGVSTEFSAGLGHVIARTKTKIASDLLDVRGDSTDSSGHVFVGANLTYAPPQPVREGQVVFLEGRLKRYTTGQYGLNLALGVGFQH